MTRLFRSKSWRLVGLSELNPETRNDGEGKREVGDDEEEEMGKGFIGNDGISSNNNNQFAIVDLLVAALRKSVLVTCSIERDVDGSSMDISWPSDVRHVSHVTFDRFNGFLGLPVELQPDVPVRVPSASVSVFGVSAKSMQCCYDDRGNSVPTILLRMQKLLYSDGGLKAEGIFRVNAENSHEEYVREQLNKGFVPHGIDVHCLSGLIKAWFRELPAGILDSLTPEQVMQCNTEDDCSHLVKSLPPTEAALLDWAINLMADVVQHEQYNKMNARNIAMVFAPNMTQMADPLTALMHAVQVMNFLKTLILKTLRERGDGFPINKTEPHLLNSTREPCSEPTIDDSATRDFSSTVILDRKEPISACGSSPAMIEIGKVMENQCGNGEYENADWLNLRKGVRRLCRHPVFHFSKQTKKAWA